MQFQVKSLLRVGMLAAVLTVALPAYAVEEVNVTAKTPVMVMGSETADKNLTIGGNTVRVKLVGPTAYVAVSKGTVEVTYADGTALTTLPEGTALQVNGFVLGSGVTANLSGGKAMLSLGAGVEFKLQTNNKGATLKLQSGTTTVTLEPGKSAQVQAPVTTFSAGQSVTLKEGQLGKATAGACEVYAVGGANSLAVTTRKEMAAIKGGGTDRLILSKDAVLTINNGSLYVSAEAVSLTGSQMQLVSTAGTIQVEHNGKNTPFATGQKIGGGAPVTQPVTQPATTLPPAATTEADDTEPGETEVEEAEVTEADAQVLMDLDNWTAAQ